MITIKFTDGYWHMRPGVTPYFPVHVHDVEVEAEALTVYGPTRHLTHRGDTLNLPLLAVRFSSPLPNVIRVMISVGSIHGGTAPNVLVDHLELGGTIRAYDEASRQKLVNLLQDALDIARNLGGDYELKITKAIAAMVNDPDMIELIRAVAVAFLGQENVAPQIVGLGGEDFGHMIEVCGGHGAMFILGSAIEGEARPTHISDFVIDERCLPIGAAVLAETAVRYLKATWGPASA